MRRFWREAAAVKTPAGWRVALDGKPIATPARAALLLPTEALARAVAAEWAGAGETVAPAAMPLTGLANAAIDRADALTETLAQYAESDLLCYRAEGPAPLVARQAAAWDAPLAWAAARYDVAFTVTAGVAPVRQPPATIARLRAPLAAHGAFALAGLHPVVTITGSLVLGLALAEGAIDAAAAWEAGELDPLWQAENWGEDAEATAAREARRAALMAGATFLALAGDRARREPEL